MTNLPQPFKKSGQKIGPDGSNRVFFDAYTAEQMLKFRQDAIEALDKHIVQNTKLCLKRIAEITEECDTLRQQLAEAQRDAERYRFLRDHFATKSENSVDDFIALEPMTGEYFDAHIDILMSEFHAAMKGAA